MRPIERIESRIFLARGQRVMLDADLAALYGVTVRRLNEQVRRNRDRFPKEFCFRLVPQELGNLKSQNATSSWGGKRKLPLAFTEHGALMAATVLTSPEPIKLSVFVIRAFVRMRESLVASRQVAAQLDALERRVGTHDRAIRQIFDALRELTQPAEPPKRRRIGFL